MESFTPAISAPIYTVPPKEIVAVEHPMIVKNIDNGLKTFGGLPLRQILINDDRGASIPLYLRAIDRTAVPILSHNTATNNVLLKITVPKRTGRKRKRGSTEPYLPDFDNSALKDTLDASSKDLRSHSRIDESEDLLRRLKDNINDYQIEAVGQIEQTHRFRGLSDFHYSTTHANFMTKVRDKFLTGDLEKLKEFKLDPKRGVHPIEELIPPPRMTDHPLPFNWAYHQSSSTKVTTDEQTGQKVVVNHTTVNKINTAYIGYDIDPIPDRVPTPPPDNHLLGALVREAKKALETRPIWTRRALMNHLGPTASVSLFKHAVQYIGYQFRGGPWRDAVIKYGVDPRTDPKYRIYQTLFFKILDDSNREPGEPWQDNRSEYTRNQNVDNISRESHIFDGKTISLDGKVWQVCDITDPVLKEIASTETIRDKCDGDSDGWFCNATMAKLKAVMRVKISAILAGYDIPDSEFAQSLAVPDHVDTKNKSKPFIPVPDWRPPEDRNSATTAYEAKSAFTAETMARRRRLRAFAGRAKSTQEDAQDTIYKQRRSAKARQASENFPESESFGTMDGSESLISSIEQSETREGTIDPGTKRRRGRPRKVPIPDPEPNSEPIGTMDGAGDLVRSIEEDDVDEDDDF